MTVHFIDDEKVDSSMTLLKRNAGEASRPSRTSHGHVSYRMAENKHGKDTKPGQSLDVQAVNGILEGLCCSEIWLVDLLSA